MKSPIKIAVTGAAGRISYSLLFRIAKGEMLGYDQPIILRLLDVETAIPVLKSIVMELNDCAYTLLQEISINCDPFISFMDIDIAILIGAHRRSQEMTRKDLINMNCTIFQAHGKALNIAAKTNVKVLIVGNPSNTNALIALKNAPNLNPQNFTALMRLDHNRAINQVAHKVKVNVTNIKKVIIWGNHSLTQYPDIFHTTVNNKLFHKMVDHTWIENYFIPTIQKRGDNVIKIAGISSAASPANAIINHIHDWIIGTSFDDWVTMAVPSDGNYDIPKGVIYGFPVTCKNGEYKIVPGLEINKFSRKYMMTTYNELIEEQNCIPFHFTTGRLNSKKT